jgi:AmiR/NasT family two-component response regulator
MFIATLESGVSMMVQRERIVELETELEQLRAVIQDNKIVEQATGAISVRYRMSPNDAFEMLRDGARAQRRNLHELAWQVTANGGSFAGA